jgi:hypothetical protein
MEAGRSTSSPSTAPYLPTPIPGSAHLASNIQTQDDDPLQLLLSMADGMSHAQGINHNHLPNSLEQSIQQQSYQVNIMEMEDTGFTVDPILELLYPSWPPRLPPPPLLHHLVEVFFANFPHSGRIIHKATFLTKLTFPPTSPHFPHTGLLHAICATAAFFSPHVSQAQLPDFSRTPAHEIFPQGAAKRQAIGESFGEEQARYAKDCIDEAMVFGTNLFDIYQSSLSLPYLSWWSKLTLARA